MAVLPSLYGAVSYLLLLRAARQRAQLVMFNPIATAVYAPCVDVAKKRNFM